MPKDLKMLYEWKAIGVVDSLEEAHYLEQELMGMNIRCRLIGEDGKEILSNQYDGDVSITVPLKYADYATEWFEGDLVDVVGIENKEPITRPIRRVQTYVKPQKFHKRYYVLLIILALFAYFAAKVLATVQW